MQNNQITPCNENTEAKDAQLVDLAVKALSQHNDAKGKSLLLSVIKHCPFDYQPQFEDEEGNLCLKFWQQSDYDHYLNYHGQDHTVHFYPCAYPRAYFYLSILEIKSHNYEQALTYLEQGSALEPTNPKFTVEKAHILQQMGQNEAALEAYQTIEGLTAYITPKDYAMALEGQGNILREMGNISGAHCAYQAALDLMPNNARLRNEIESLQTLPREEPVNLSDNLIFPTQSANRCLNCGQVTTDGYICDYKGVALITCLPCRRKQFQRKAWELIAGGFVLFLLSALLYWYLNDFEQSGDLYRRMNLFIAIIYQIAGKEITCTLIAGIGGLSVFSGVAILCKTYGK